MSSGNDACEHDSGSARNTSISSGKIGWVVWRAGWTEGIAEC